MRQNDKNSLWIFAIVLVLLLGGVVFNHVTSRMNQSLAQKYVPTATKKDKNDSKNEQVKSEKTSLQNDVEPAKMTGEFEGKTIAELGIKPGFYDLKLSGGDSEYFSFVGLAADVPVKAVFLNPANGYSLEAGRTVDLAPAKFDQLEKRGEIYVIKNPGNYLPNQQIKPGKYKVTAEGEMIKQAGSTSKAGTMIIVQLTNYEGQTVGNDIVALYDDDNGGTKEGVLTVEKDRLVNVSANEFDPNTQILLTPID